MSEKPYAFNTNPLGVFCFITFQLLIQISWNFVTFPKIYLGLILWIFVQCLTWFLQCQHFFTTRCYFLCMLSVGIMHTSLAMLIVFESRGFRKTCIQFSNNTFPIGTVIMSLGSIYGEFDLLIKILNLNDRLDFLFLHSFSGILSTVSYPETFNVFRKFVLHVRIYLFIYDSFKNLWYMWQWADW